MAFQRLGHIYSHKIPTNGAVYGLGIWRQKLWLPETIKLGSYEEVACLFQRHANVLLL